MRHPHNEAGEVEEAKPDRQDEQIRVDLSRRPPHALQQRLGGIIAL
jgi:hypothetical protein